MDATNTDPKTAIETAAAHLGLTMSAVFIPWDKSRKAGEKTPSLNWKVTILKNGKPFFTCDYTAGIGHCPSYDKFPLTLFVAERTASECGSGRSRKDGKPILPELADVLSSLVLDAEAIDYPTFESWASALGFDTDSRAAEKTYRARLESALAIRAAIGEGGLTMLRQAADGY